MESGFKKTILINSPPGSGNNFCEFLIKQHLDVNVMQVLHNPKLFNESFFNIFILRNPYDSICSAVEIDLLSKSGIEILVSDYLQINKKINNLNLKNIITDLAQEKINLYLSFLEEVKNKEYIKKITFEFLTNNYILLLEHISKEAGIEFKNNVFLKQISKNEIFKNMSENMIFSRIPRNIIPLRKVVNDLLLDYGPIVDLKNDYIVYKNNIDSEKF
jgi:hypothetical protein